MNWRYGVLLATILGVGVAMAMVPAIPQDPAYHNFSDHRAFVGVPNCLDSLSNVFFLIVGVLGIRFTLGSGAKNAFIGSSERWPYVVFFIAVTVTAFGSAYYHLKPSNARLVWDRLPMSLGFASLLPQL